MFFEYKTVAAESVIETTGCVLSCAFAKLKEISINVIRSKFFIK